MLGLIDLHKEAAAVKIQQELDFLANQERNPKRHF